MRSSVCALGLLLLIPAASAQGSGEHQATASAQYQTGYCPQTHVLEAEPQAEYWFEGTVGDRTARLYLDRGGPGVVGSLYFTAGDWTPILLGGEWDNGALVLSDGTEQHPPSVRVRGSLTQQQFTGTWVPEDGHGVEPVRLATVPQPRCDGRGPWKRFDNPQWPVSFSYPANWRLRESGQSITLTCPDPRAMAYESDVTVDRGVGTPSGRDGLTQCSAGWRYSSSCDCSHPDASGCSVPKITKREGITILSLDDQEWRLYCRGGGYVGQGEGDDRIVLLPNGWIEFSGAGDPSAVIDRIAVSVRPRAEAGGK